MSDRSTLDINALTGDASGVPFVVIPPHGARDHAATVIVWHMHDPPRSERAMAAALPLRGVDAWRVYLGLPLSGSRLPAGGLDAFFALGYEDAVLKLYGPTVQQAVDEFPAAFAELRRQHGLAEGPIAVVGASVGALVALSLVASGEPQVSAIALVSPALRLASVVAANERRFAVTYQWSDDSRAIAAELDFVARAPEVARKPAPTLFVIGGDDDADGIGRPAEELAAALLSEDVTAEVIRILAMGHAIADEPGLQPAPQTAVATAVDDVDVGPVAGRHWLGGCCRHRAGTVPRAHAGRLTVGRHDHGAPLHAARSRLGGPALVPSPDSDRLRRLWGAKGGSRIRRVARRCPGRRDGRRSGAITAGTVPPSASAVADGGELLGQAAAEGGHQCEEA